MKCRKKAVRVLTLTETFDFEAFEVIHTITESLVNIQWFESTRMQNWISVSDANGDAVVT